MRPPMLAVTVLVTSSCALPLPLPFVNRDLAATGTDNPCTAGLNRDATTGTCPKDSGSSAVKSSAQTCTVAKRSPDGLQCPGTATYSKQDEKPNQRRSPSENERRWIGGLPSLKKTASFSALPDGSKLLTDFRWPHTMLRKRGLDHGLGPWKGYGRLSDADLEALNALPPMKGKTAQSDVARDRGLGPQTGFETFPVALDAELTKKLHEPPPSGVTRPQKRDISTGTGSSSSAQGAGLTKRFNLFPVSNGIGPATSTTTGLTTTSMFPVPKGIGPSTGITGTATIIDPSAKFNPIGVGPQTSTTVAPKTTSMFPVPKGIGPSTGITAFPSFNSRYPLGIGPETSLTFGARHKRDLRTDPDHEGARIEKRMQMISIPKDGGPLSINIGDTRKSKPTFKPKPNVLVLGKPVHLGPGPEITGGNSRVIHIGYRAVDPAGAGAAGPGQGPAMAEMRM